MYSSESACESTAARNSGDPSPYVSRSHSNAPSSPTNDAISSLNSDWSLRNRVAWVCSWMIRDAIWKTEYFFMNEYKGSFVKPSVLNASTGRTITSYPSALSREASATASDRS